MGGQKAVVVDQIARSLSIPMPPMSIGSTEPKSILVAVSDVLGLGLDQNLSKPLLAERICRAAGLDWDRTCWSTGSTVTLIGLRRVLTSVRVLTGEQENLELFEG